MGQVNLLWSGQYVYCGMCCKNLQLGYFLINTLQLLASHPIGPNFRVIIRQVQFADKTCQNNGIMPGILHAWWNCVYKSGIRNLLIDVCNFG